ncbi:DUF6443 domain-containing protein [Chryseobacterium sp. JM1]|uniref:DUF6443 domain-containing protein n=1 Tax=Chryseobacterium sp. JM1 TaxID=1233950 RepID=UPI00068BF129|nr:DUF6443 domain-containing protein [Chryseobacterium sp. JM1]
MKKLIIPIGTLLLSGLVHAQVSNTENYVQSKTYLEPVTSSNSTVKQLETIQYVDGLGRPKQIVNVKASPSGKDLVTTIPYDGFGRPVDSWLPVPMATLNGGIQSGVNTAGTAFYGDSNPFGHKNLESSPLDRVLTQVQSGSDWQGHAVQFQYDANNDGEVYKFVTTTTFPNGATSSVLKTSGNSVHASSGFYKANKLYKNIVIDEDGNKTTEFKNGEGQVLMVRKFISAAESADTYYVYNEYNLLAFVIPPKAVGLLKGSGLADGQTVDNPILKDLCYQYRYDARRRLVEKKIPGKEWEYMVYDKQDRPVLTQDANMGILKQWLFTKYDQYGRIAYTGMYTSSQNYGSTGRLAEQINVDSKGSNNVLRSGTVGFTQNGMDVYYDNGPGSFPSSITKLLSINYYDSYASYTFNPSFTDILGEPVLTDASSLESRSTKSLPVMSLIKNIEDDQWTKNYTFYDKKGRAIGSYSINHMGGRTKTDSKLDFAGAVQQTVTRHKRLDSDVDKVITENFTYDVKNRLLTHTHQVDNNFVEVLSQNSYNDISQLINKKVGGYPSLGGGGFIQSIDYQYNIRGWMTKVNDPSNLGGKLFGYEMRYHNPLSVSQTTGKYNGNIAEIDWKTSKDGILKRYSYQYDVLNRLKKGIYSEPGTSIPQNNYFNESVGYDLNGNITELQRNRNAANIGAELIDNLTYVYTGNRLDTVTDSSQNHFGYPDTSGALIHYDDNGNMTDHKDKRISGIVYNHLNLPNRIQKETLISGGFGSNLQESTRYIYRADGAKLHKDYNYYTGRNNNPVTSSVDYLDGFQYTGEISGGILDPWGTVGANMQLQFVPTSEGYYDFVQNKYIYQYKDHLGNIRLSFYKDSNNAATIDRTTDYYPFGLTFGDNGLNSYGSLSPNYTYGYNGKEFQSETKMYDYGARMYMPELGRWGVTDPLAEKYFNISPYAYAANNPIIYVDPNGMDVILYGEEAQQLFERLKNATSLKLTYDKESKKLGIEGAVNVKKLKGYDKTLYDAITNDKKVINIKTDSDVLQETLQLFHGTGAGFYGTFNSDGKRQSLNIVNFDIISMYEDANGKKYEGVAFLHEILEGYFATEEKGTLKAARNDETSYVKIHNKAQKDSDGGDSRSLELWKNNVNFKSKISGDTKSVDGNKLQFKYWNNEKSIQFNYIYRKTWRSL